MPPLNTKYLCKHIKYRSSILWAQQKTMNAYTVFLEWRWGCGVLHTELNKSKGKGDGLAVVYISTTPTLHHFPLFLSRSISSSLLSHYTYTLSLSMNNASLTRTQNILWCHSGAMWQLWLWPLPAKHSGTSSHKEKTPWQSFAGWWNYFHYISLSFVANVHLARCTLHAFPK